EPGRITCIPQGFVFDLTLTSDCVLATTDGLAGTVAVTAMPGEKIVLHGEATLDRLIAISVAGVHPVQLAQPTGVARLS
ncbi:hypothetical protein ABTM60_20515, partial [Acinetobacter baumannii]